MRQIIVPRITANEDVVVFVDVCKNNNDFCKKGEAIAVFESTKALFEMQADSDGYIYFVVPKGSRVKIGEVIAYMSNKKLDNIFLDMIKRRDDKKKTIANNEKLIITHKAQALLNEHGLNAHDIKESGILKTVDVKGYLNSASASEVNKVISEIYDYKRYEEIFKSNETGDVTIEDVIKLKRLLSYVSNIYAKQWNRRIPVLDVLFDRWSNAKINNFGENSNISHLSYIFGDVKVGKNTFIGPFTYIDGSGGLQIGDNCSIAVGVQIYSHDTIARALSGRKAKRVSTPTTIGDNCFIGPNAIIGKGVSIGNNCFIGANSLVTCDVPDNAVMMGVPAKKVGSVLISPDGGVSIMKQRPRMPLVFDPWLADILKRDVYKVMVNDDFITKAEDPASDVNAIFRSKPVFIYAKVSTTQLSSVALLEKLGFYLVNTNVVFDKPISASFKNSSNCEIRFALPQDERETVELSRRSIVYSRFHMDGNLKKETADSIKAEWVKNYFLGKRGEAMVVAIKDKSVVGFLQLLQDKNGVLTIDLMAVDENYRRRGIGTDMIAYAECHCKGVSQIRVGTQLANIPSIRLYQSMGFKMVEAQYIYHYHNI